MSVFPDTAVFNLQGDKGEPGAAGRDVSFARSPLHHYSSNAFLLSLCFHTLSTVSQPAFSHPLLPLLILPSMSLLYYTLSPFLSPLHFSLK